MSQFHLDRDTRGHPAEQVLLELLTLQGIRAELNPTPDPDTAPDEETRRYWYESRAAYDIWVEGEWWDVKADFFSYRTGDICAEKNSLTHTRSTKFAYLLPNTSGIYFYIFPVADLKTLYNAQNAIPRGDGTFYHQYRYPHKVVGQQATNEAVLLPREITETVGRSLWQEVKTIKHQIV